MKKNHLQSLSLLIFITFFMSSSFTTDTITSEIPFHSGYLEGEASVTMSKTIDKISGRTLEGQYKNNQKVGSWKLWDKNHKLLQERIYKNSFEYSLVKKDKEVAFKFPLKRGENGVFPFPKIEEADIAVVKRIWKLIPQEYLASNNALTYAISRIDFTEFKAYYDDKLTTKDSTNEIKSLNFSNLNGIRIMGDWYYDQKRKIANFQILSISPVIEEDERQFWFFYPDMRISNSKIEAESKNTMVNNLDDIFFFGDYPSNIYKIESVENTQEKESELIEYSIKSIEVLLSTEAAYWLK